MKFRRRRSSLLPRPDWRADREAAKGGVRGATRTRPPARREEPGAPRRRWLRVLAVGLAGAEALILVALLNGPLFRVHHVDVDGAHRLSRTQVVTLAGLAGTGSVFGVDSGAAAGRLGTSVWVREAAVSAQLPDRVSVRVAEWQPVAVYRAGPDAAFYLSDRAVALGPAAEGAPGLLQVEGPTAPELRAGRRPLDPQLLTALVNIQRRLPGLIGQPAKSFQLDGCGVLAMTTGRGWRVIFGRVLTPEEFQSLPDKLAAVRSVQPFEDFNSPALEYINVENPSQVAVHHQGDRVPAPSPPPPSPAPRPGASPAARPTAPPTPAPTPTPLPVAPCR